MLWWDTGDKINDNEADDDDNTNDNMAIVDVRMYWRERCLFSQLKRSTSM